MDFALLAPFAPFLMVVGIVWVKSREKLEEKRIAAAERTKASQPSQDTARVEELEERVRVLERIVTDRSYDLAGQIEALRDQQSLPGHRQAEPGKTLERAR